MIQKFKISWFRREAGLFFLTAALIVVFVLTDACGHLLGSVSFVHAEETPDDSGTQPESADLAQTEGTGSIVIVIDPGHGGDNLGGEYEDYTEKDMTLIVARAMKEELDQYEGITVYLTRTDDTALTLEERCEFAAGVGADFLFCLHFNMSKYHTLFGAETWVSAFGEYYSKGRTFAAVEMELLKEMGLYSRGTKTRLNDEGVDYYGIIRHSTERNIPCVLIEHCHLDQENDQPFYDHKEKLEAFGRLDAEAVAKYYGLRSESLGKDFSSYRNISVPVPAQTMMPDLTEPEICMIDLIGQNMDTGDITLSVSAVDYDSGMLYYSYSYDGGQTFSDLQRWPDQARDTFELTINVPSGVIPQVVVNAYNGYDLYTASNTLSLPSMSYKTAAQLEEEAARAKEAEMTDEPQPLDDPQRPADDDAAVKSASGKAVSGAGYRKSSSADADTSTESADRQPATIRYFLEVCLICAALVFAMILSMLVILRSYKKRRRRRHR